MPMMTGEAYRRSLLDGRRCCIDGELITDPSQHPMLKTAVDSVSRRDGGGGMHRQRMLALDSFDLAPVKARARAAAGIAS